MNTNPSYTYDEHEVFHGISIAYQCAHTQNANQPNACNGNSVFKIFHCKQGRMECSIDDNYCYISQGDLLIVNAQSLSDSLFFPINHYHGTVITIDTDVAPKCLSCFLSDVNVQPRTIMKKFCSETNFFIARSNASFEHIFSELYNIPEEIYIGYLKIKILELMLFLSVFGIDKSENEKRTLSPSKALIAKKASAIVFDRMNERITIEHLAEVMNVSASSIKAAFKSVYCVSFYTFIKTGKMESAAHLLENSSMTITEIAGEHGYDNPGKFAAAFKSVKGISPSEYRVLYSKLI